MVPSIRAAALMICLVCSPLVLRTNSWGASTADGLAPVGLAAGAAEAQSDEIHRVAAAGDLATLKALLDADPKRAESRNIKGQTPLHVAAQAKRPEAVALLLAQGADVRAIDAEKYTPLHRAALVGDAESCRRLIEAGADVKSVEAMGRTPLMLACGFGDGLPAVKQLIAAGSDVNYAVPGSNNVLLAALYFGRPEVIDFLVESGARLAGDRRSIMTGLAIAARNGRQEVFRMAADMAAAAGVQVEKAVSLLDVASGGSVETGRFLLDKGVDVNGKNVYAWTALHAAAARGHAEFASLLLDRGARIDEPDRMGRTAWHLAREGKHAAVADMLRDRGASTAEPKFPELRGPWLGQPDPGAAPAMFAPGIVSGYDFESEHSPVAFTPDGNEAYWTKKFRGPILVSRRVNGIWTAPCPAPFNSSWGDGEPFVAPDGKRLYFLSFRPLQPGGRSDKENIWFVEREGDGWGAPRPEAASVNAYDQHWLFSVAADGTLWFSAPGADGKGGRDIYRAAMADGLRQAPRNAGPVINTAGDEHMPFIAPDGSYLIFSRRGEPGDGGQFRFRISYRDGDGWTKPVGLGEAIDSVVMALCPLVTPDGTYMFFLGQGDVFWVRADFIEALRPKR
jgi:ankyrin repeat protein